MKLTLWFFALCALMLVQPRVLGQEQGKPIVVSPLIGDTLDAVERETYELLQKLERFQWAVFYLNPDSSLMAKVSLVQNGVRQDTIISLYCSLPALRYYIGQVVEERGVPLVRRDHQKPPLHGGRVIGELFAGAGAAAFLGVGGAVIAASESQSDPISAGVAGLLIGFALGPPVGVYLVGSGGDEMGSFAATFAGSLVGGGLGLLMATGIENDDLVFLPIAAGSVVGATVGFNLTRDVEEPETPTSALLTSANGNLQLGIPSLRIRPHPIDRSPMQTVDLVRVQF